MYFKFHWACTKFSEGTIKNQIWLHVQMLCLNSEISVGVKNLQSKKVSSSNSWNWAFTFMWWCSTYWAKPIQTTIPTNIIPIIFVGKFLIMGKCPKTNHFILFKRKKKYNKYFFSSLSTRDLQECDEGIFLSIFCMWKQSKK